MYFLLLLISFVLSQRVPDAPATCKNEIDCNLNFKFADNPCLRRQMAQIYQQHCTEASGVCQTASPASFCRGCLPIFTFKAIVKNYTASCKTCTSVKCFEASYFFESCSKLKVRIALDSRRCNIKNASCVVQKARLQAVKNNYKRNECATEAAM